MQNTRKVTDDIVWVGCNDRRLTLFENLFPIPRGVSYNSYLVMDEKVTLLDTVDVCALQQFMENIDYVLDGKEIDYLIVQHMEPDHGAGIQEMMRRFPNMMNWNLTKNGLQMQDVIMQILLVNTECRHRRFLRRRQDLIFNSSALCMVRSGERTCLILLKSMINGVNMSRKIKRL